MAYKFEGLEVWQLSIDYLDLIYTIANKLPREEQYNLKSQITRAATSVSLNVAEGSTGQSDPEQKRFIGYAIRSLVETVACQHIIKRRNYAVAPVMLQDAYRQSERLFAKLQALRAYLAKSSKRGVWEDPPLYVVEEDPLAP